MVNLDLLARSSGTFAMLAIDQREALRGMRAKAADQPVEEIPDSALIEFKLEVIRALSPLASAVLMDEEMAARPALDQGALLPDTGLVIAVDQLVGPPGKAAQETAIDRSVDLTFWKEVGAVGAKLLAFWDPARPNLTRSMVADFISLSQDADLAAVLEIIVDDSNGAGRFAAPQTVVDAAAWASQFPFDLYKAQVPYGGDPSVDADLIRHACEQLTARVGRPWVVLSNGVSAEDFPRAVQIACEGGASGFLAGRAIWEHAATSQDFSGALRTESAQRLQHLCQIVDEHGVPWSKSAAGSGT